MNSAICYTHFAPLSTLINENPNGTWTLYVQDVVNGEGGTLNGWGLNINRAICGSPCLDTILIDEEYGIGSINHTICCAATNDTVVFSPAMANDTVMILMDSIEITNNLTLIADPNDNIWIDASAVDAFLIVNPGVTLWLEGVNIIAPAVSPGKVLCFHGNVTLKDVNICSPNGESGVLLDGNGTLDILGDSNVKGSQ